MAPRDADTARELHRLFVAGRLDQVEFEQELDLITNAD